MYSFHDRTFTAEDGLLSYLSRRVREAPGRTALVAGHFMLAYSAEHDELLPMVWQDVEEPSVREFSRRMAGEFPLRTFRYGLDLWEEVPGEADLVLLVNDHKFQSSSFQPGARDAVRGRGGALRRSFYESRGAELPLSFQAEAERRGLNSSTFLSPYESTPGLTTRPLDDGSVFTSEQVLRNRFDDKTRDRLVQDRAFSLVDVGRGKSQVFFNPGYSASHLCLTKDGTCDCSGEVLELYRDLHKRGYRHIVLFAPDECADPVNVGTEVALYLIHTEANSDIEVDVIWGLGGMGHLGEAVSPLSPSYVRSHRRS